MALPASDDFNRADANPAGGNWSPALAPADVQILGNAISGLSTQGDTFGYWNADVPDADQYAECTGHATATDGGPAVRVSTTAITGYCYFLGSSIIAKFIAGGFNSLHTVTDTYSSTAVYRLKVTGAVNPILTVYKDGVEIGSFTDTTSVITSGRIGVFCFSDAAILDNWAGGNVSSGVIINGITGNAIADGSIAALNRIIISATGNAVADGSTGVLNRALSSFIGNAIANGSTANIETSILINGITGNAIADGSVFALNREIDASGQLVANWTISDDTSVTQYYIYLSKLTGVSKTTYQRIITVAGRTTATTTITGLEVGVTYYFVITSAGAGGHDEFESDDSAEVSFAAYYVDGNAVANGLTATLGQGVVGEIGNAVADGSTAALNMTLSSSVGNSAADGAIAALNRTQAGVIGNAVADGIIANVTKSGNTTINGLLGDAIANGLVFASNVSITTIVGGSVADGSAFFVNRTVAHSIGSAIADGAIASITNENALTINGIIGNAVANGSTFFVNRSISATPGNAVADGHDLFYASERNVTTIVLLLRAKG